MDKKYSNIAIEELEKNIERMQEQVRLLKQNKTVVIEGCIYRNTITPDTWSGDIDININLITKTAYNTIALLSSKIGKNCRITIEPLE